MVPKISQWFRKLGMVPKIRDGLDLRNIYENVVILSTLGKFSKIGSTYLWLLPSSASNNLRHLFTRCPCFLKNILVVRKFFANCPWKVSYIRSTFWSTQQLINSNKNNSWKREKQTKQNPFHARLVQVLISESSLRTSVSQGSTISTVSHAVPVRDTKFSLLTLQGVFQFSKPDI